MNLKLEDFIPCYPSQDDEKIQEIVTHKYEFLSQKTGMTEKVPEDYRPYGNQELFARLVFHFDNLFNISDAGTGKTGSVILACELLKKYCPSIKKYFIIVKGNSAKDEWIRQIMLFCRNKYSYDSNKNLCIESFKQLTTKNNIKAEYNIMTIYNFCKKIEEKKSNDKDFKEYFSNSFIAIDEVQMLQNDSNTSSNYNTINYLFKNIVSSKKILLSATPAINKQSEIIRLLNLLVPEEEQLDPNGDITDDQIRELCRGRVCYVKKLDTGIEIEDVGEDIPGTGIVGVKLEMKDLQREIFLKRNESKDETFFTQTRQASNFVFPDGTVSGKLNDDSHGLGKYVIYSDHTYIANEKIKSKCFKNIENNTKYLRKYSCKISYIIDNERDKKGVFYVYNEFVNGSGGIIDSIALELAGYERFSELSFNDTKTLTIENLEPKKRFVLITAEMLSSCRNAAWNIILSPKNIDGDYIKCIYGTKIIRDGSNISHVLRIYLHGACFHKSGSYQAQMRAIRVLSHNNLVERNKLLGLPKVKVQVYKLIAYAIDDNGVEHSIDEHLYRLSHDKYVEIEKIMNILQECSLDYYINYERNTGKKINIENIDYSTYDILYSSDIVHDTMDKIVKILNRYGSITILELLNMTKVREKFLYVAINNLTNEMNEIKNSFGMFGIIICDGYKVYICNDNNVSLSNRLDTSYYSDKLFFQHETLTSTIIDNHIKLNSNYDINLLSIMDEDDIKKYIAEASKIIYIKLFEDAFICKIKRERMPRVYERILELNTKSIFETTESKQAMNYVIKNKKNKKINWSKFKPTEEDGPIIYIHTIHGKISEAAGQYTAIPNYNNVNFELRLLKSNETEWCTADENEQKIYSNFIIKERNERNKDILEREIYGIIIDNSLNFRIIDNKKSKNKGCVIDQIQQPQLISIAIRLNIKTVYIDNPSETDINKAIKIYDDCPNDFEYNDKNINKIISFLNSSENLRNKIKNFMVQKRMVIDETI
jgi:hypothetical protein